MLIDQLDSSSKASQISNKKVDVVVEEVDEESNFDDIDPAELDDALNDITQTQVIPA